MEVFEDINYARRPKVKGGGIPDMYETGE